jgi:hypothetical protein
MPAIAPLDRCDEAAWEEAEVPELSSEGFELAAESVDVEEPVEELAEPVDEPVDELVDEIVEEPVDDPVEEPIDAEEGVAAAGVLDLLGVVDGELG